MKKILHMTPPVIKNGIYRYIFNHMAYIDQRNYQFSFLTKNPEELTRTKEFRRYRFPVRGFCNVERGNPAGLRKEITRILGEGYDVIHLHTSYWRGFLIEEIAMEMKIPRVIVHAHSTGIDEPDEAARRELLAGHEAYKERFGMQYATDLCACSEPAGRWLYRKELLEKGIHILPNAIDVERFRFRQESRGRIRRRLGIDGKIVIGNTGRYCYQKNQSFLLEAFARARKRNGNLFLLFLGEGELLDGLRGLAEHLGIREDVCFMGWQERPEEYLLAMDVFCLPSRFEGLPISVMEAQASGLKCLVSDRVTRECDITGMVEFLPLETQLWVEKLAAARPDTDRQTCDERFWQAGYSMEASGQRLTRLYDGSL